MKKALVVGGSGMLAGVTHWLVEQGYEVYVIGRSKRKMAKLMSHSERIHPLYVDYRQLVDFKQKLKQTFDWDLIIAWFHHVPENPMETLLESIHEQETNCHLYHVLGSSSNLSEIKRTQEIPETCHYHQVQLGFKIEHNQSRWLTNNEISNGVIEAIKSGQSTYTVGQLEPWDQRP